MKSKRMTSKFQAQDWKDLHEVLTLRIHALQGIGWDRSDVRRLHLARLTALREKVKLRVAKATSDTGGN